MTHYPVSNQRTPIQAFILTRGAQSPCRVQPACCRHTRVLQVVDVGGSLGRLRVALVAVDGRVLRGRRSRRRAGRAHHLSLVEGGLRLRRGSGRRRRAATQHGVRRACTSASASSSSLSDASASLCSSTMSSHGSSSRMAVSRGSAATATDPLSSVFVAVGASSPSSRARRSETRTAAVTAGGLPARIGADRPAVIWSRRCSSRSRSSSARPLVVSRRAASSAVTSPCAVCTSTPSCWAIARSTHRLSAVRGPAHGARRSPRPGRVGREGVDVARLWRCPQPGGGRGGGGDV